MDKTLCICRSNNLDNFFDICPPKSNLLENYTMLEGESLCQFMANIPLVDDNSATLSIIQVHIDE